MTNAVNVAALGSGPAFSANHNTGGDQTVSANTWTKVNLETEVFDTNNNFSSSRFTPTVAGYYQLSGCLYAGGSYQSCALYKNGSQYAAIGTNTTQGWAQGSCLVYLNGSTDYVELYGFTNGTSFYTGAAYVYLTGSLTRAA